MSQFAGNAVDKLSHLSIVSNDIAGIVDDVIPNGAGSITGDRLSRALDKISQRAFEEGRVYALTNLMTTEEAAEIIGVSIRRMRAIAKNRHDKFGTGWKVPGTGVWLFTPEEINTLKPR